MRKVFAAALVALFPAVGQAADLVTKAPRIAQEAPFNWSGLQIYGYGEYGANLSAVDVSVAGGMATLNGASVETGPGIGGGLSLLYQAAGSDWVLGIRAEIDYLNLRGSSTLNMGGLGSLSVSNSTNYSGDFNGVLGYALSPRLLGYVTGGLAFGGARPNLSVFSGNQALVAAAADTSVGWNVGFGFDYALTPNWIMGIEANYARLGDKSLSLGGLITSNNPLSVASQRLKIGYKF